MKKILADYFPSRAAKIFLLALFLQSGHMVEHVAQLYQHMFLRLPIQESHGILFFLDLEWNHFLFNLGYFLLLGYVLLAFVASGIGKVTSKFWMSCFYVGLAVQGYHVIEHSSRIGQFFQTGCTPCPGILAWRFDGIYLHFIFNSVTLILPLLAFLYLTFRRKFVAPNFK